MLHTVILITHKTCLLTKLLLIFKRKVYVGILETTGILTFIMPQFPTLSNLYAQLITLQ
jgi:hypothetical protein